MGNVEDMKGDAKLRAQENLFTTQATRNPPAARSALQLAHSMQRVTMANGRGGKGLFGWGVRRVRAAVARVGCMPKLPFANFP